MNKAQQIVDMLLTEARRVNRPSPKNLPQYQNMDMRQFNDFVWDLPRVESGRERFAVDRPHYTAFYVGWDSDPYALVFEPKEFEEFMKDKKEWTPQQRWQPPPPPPEYSLEQKRAHLVYESGNYIFLKLPEDHDFIRREGTDMRHCLSTAYASYCDRMKTKEIEVYSMTDVRDNKPKVDIEVALIQPSYWHSKVEKPTVTQIRGAANEVPPKDEYIPALMDFFAHFGKDWALSGHGVRNFDGRVDGDLLVQRWEKIRSNTQG